MSDKIPVQSSSGNVFADLGIKNPEEYLAKSELAAQIQKIIHRRKFTQVEAGRLMGISQPNVSDLLRGRLDAFATDRLLLFIIRLGYNVRIKVTKARAKAPAHMEVVA